MGKRKSVSAQDSSSVKSKKSRKTKHPPEYYEMRAPMSDQEAQAVRTQIEEHTKAIKELRVQLRGAKPRSLLKPEYLKKIRQETAKNLVEFRFKRKGGNLVIEQEEQEAGAGDVHQEENDYSSSDEDEE